MGPVIGVPNEVAQRIKEETELVEVDEVLPDVVDEFDIQLGVRPKTSCSLSKHQEPDSSVW